MLKTGIEIITVRPFLALAPGLGILTLVVALNLLYSGLKRF
jgi:ABC-type dipeptide/oligopeptide/nickel transport system permease subunit